MVDIRLIRVAVGGFAINVEVFAFAGLLPGMAADTGVAISQAGYLASAYAVSFAISAPTGNSSSSMAAPLWSET